MKRDGCLELADATDQQAPPFQNYDHSPFSLLMIEYLTRE